MTDTAEPELIDVRIGHNTFSGRENIQWITMDYHYVPTDLGPDQPQLVGVSVMNEHDGQAPTSFDAGDEPSCEVDDETLLDLGRHCKQLGVIDTDPSTLPSGYTITLDDTFRLVPSQRRPWVAFRAGLFTCLQYHTAPLVWFNVLLCDVPLREIPIKRVPDSSQQMFDLDFVTWLAFQS